jgi:hypothetical protein
MAIEMRYRGIQFLKDYTVKYLNACFMAHAKGVLLFTDGTRAMEFSKMPIAVRAYSWVSQDLPAVLVGSASGAFEERGFSENLILNEGEDPTGVNEYLGGDIQLDLELIVRARTGVERDNLADMTCILLSKRTAKAYFLLQDIKIPKPPTIGGETEVNEPAIDFPVYDVRLSLQLESGWIEWSELDERLIDIVTDPDFVVLPDP